MGQKAVLRISPEYERSTRLLGLVSHRFELSEIMQAYNIFGNAAKERAVKVAIKNTSGEALKEKP
jgi:hypothetical protein